MLDTVLETRTGQIVISVILGLGFAIIFSKACIGRNCIVRRGPNPAVIDQKIYQFDKSCYTFEPSVVSCEKNNHKIKVDN
jgi:hypothetical protein